MSLKLAKIASGMTGKITLAKLLGAVPAKDYSDGRTKQCHKDECDINMIMARFEKTGTISHLEKYSGVYADFSDFDYHEQLNLLGRGQIVFDALPGELRREFNQSPSQFFAYVNDPANADTLRQKLSGAAAPGTQLRQLAIPTADALAADAAASEPASATPAPAPPAAAKPPAPAAPAAS